MTPQPSAIEFGRLLRSSTTGCVVGCQVSRFDAPSLGALVRIPLHDQQIYGLIYDMHIDDDGLVRQLVTADNVSEEIMLDNRVNRNVPVEISVLFVGYAQDGKIFHLLPPRPPLSLDTIFLATGAELCAFTSAGRFGYFRHILRALDLPISELLAAHIQQAAEAQSAGGDQAWASSAGQELITLLRDDYPTLMGVLSALADTAVSF